MVISLKKCNKLFIIIFAILFLLILFKQNSFNNKIISVNSPDHKNSKKINTISRTVITIDQTEDISAIGYSGQRKIIRDSANNFYLTYRKKYNGYYNIFVAKLTKKNENWEIYGTNKPIADIQTTQRVASLAIDSKDNLHVVWYGADPKKQKNNRQIKYSKSTDGGITWKKWINISPVYGFVKKNKYWQEHPSIFVGLNDELYVVWEGKDTQNKHQQIKFSRSTDGGKTWQDWKNVNISPNSQSRPTIIQDKTGRLHILMYSSLSGKNFQQIWHSYSDNDGLTWSKWENVSDSNFDARHISCVIDKNNNIHIVWRSRYYDIGPSQIFYAVLKNKLWTAPSIVRKSSNYQFFPSISISENDKISIVWMENSKKNKFPKEKPLSGKIFGMIDFSNEFTTRNAIGGYYPTLPISYKHAQLPLVFTKDNGDIVFELLDI